MEIRGYRLFVLLLFWVSLPLQACIALVIFFTVGLPVFYRQKRVGKNGKPFTLYKFRTMSPDAEKKQKLLAGHNEADGPVFKMRNDPRFTKVGRFLSHTGLDELPQLWNVVRGNMSLIGPRPLPLAEAKHLTSWQKERERVKPGIISPWILDGYHKNSFDAWMKSDIDYIQKKSFEYDCVLLKRTIVFLFRLFIQEVYGFRKHL